MRTTSDLYKSIRGEPGSYYNVAVVRNGVRYGMDKLKSIHISPSLFFENGPSIGNACATQCDIVLREDSENWPRMAEFEVTLQIRSESGSSASEWLTMGKFFTDERSYDSAGNLRISGYDIMLKTEQSWTDKITPPSEWPVTSKAWCNLIESAGLFSFDPRSGLDDSVAFIGLDTSSTIRSKLKDIAAAHGANWTVTPEGKLRLIPYTNTIIGDSAIAGIAVVGFAVVGREESLVDGYNYTEIGMQAQSLTQSPPLFAVTGADLENSEGEHTSAGNTNGYVVQGNCNFVNGNGVANLCLSCVNGYVYKPFEAKAAYLDPAAELGDLVNINDENYQIMTIEWNINHAPTADISAPYEEEIDHEYTIDSTEAKTYRKVISSTEAVNLIPYPYDYGSGTFYGITYTLNDDGSITFDGTSTSSFVHTFVENTKHLSLGPGTYTLSIANGDSDVSLQLFESDQSGYGNYFAATDGSPYTFTISEAKENIKVRFAITRVGAQFSNLTVYPQLEAGTVAHAWRSPTDSFSSQIIQNANSILLKVSQGDVASQLSIECTDGTGYVNVGTNRFTVNSDNFKLSGSGDVTSSGSFTASLPTGQQTKVSGGKITFSKSGSDYGYIWADDTIIRNLDDPSIIYGTLNGINVEYQNANAFMVDVKASDGVSNTFIMFNNSAGDKIPSWWSDRLGTYVQGRTVFHNRAYLNNGVAFVDKDRVVADYLDYHCWIQKSTGYLPNDPDQTGYGEYIALYGGLYVNNGLYVSGIKNRVVETKNYGETCLSAVESADALFSDVGSGVIDESGTCYVFFDPVFEETVNLNYEYHVFTTQTSEGNITWVEKEKDFFIVHGAEGTSFDWTVYAKQKDFEGARLTRIVPDNKDPKEDEEYSGYPLDMRYPNAKRTEEYMQELESDYDKLAEQYLKEYEEEIDIYD